jgi:hypothetical protein
VEKALFSTRFHFYSLSLQQITENQNEYDNDEETIFHGMPALLHRRCHG